MKRVPGYTINQLYYYILTRKNISMQETLERELHDLLNESGRIHWKNLKLELLNQYANMEKNIWEDKEQDYAVNNMIRIIEMAASLNKLTEERKSS